VSRSASAAPDEITIRPYAARDHAAVRALFARVNRELAPPHLRETFEAYIARGLADEIDRIEAYYAERNGVFWVALDGAGALAGMFGLEAVEGRAEAVELRRMYVAPEARRQGVARAMLAYAESEAAARGFDVITLSTSEVQPAALALYRGTGYRLVREEAGEAMTNKTVGAGLRRFYFEKPLG
jgi:ribosomal protein S18 acetylase RimI-like enzyme